MELFSRLNVKIQHTLPMQRAEVTGPHNSDEPYKYEVMVLKA